jgi:hypothetical protein
MIQDQLFKAVIEKDISKIKKVFKDTSSKLIIGSIDYGLKDLCLRHEGISIFIGVLEPKIGESRIAIDLFNLTFNAFPEFYDLSEF